MENELFEEARQTIDTFSKIIEQGELPDKKELEDFSRFLRHPKFLGNKEERETLIYSCESIQNAYYKPTREYRRKLSQSRGATIGARIVYSHLFLLRRYKSRENFRISWRFNLLGKLDLIDAFNLDRKLAYHLFISAPFTGRKSEQNVDRAIILNIPEWMQEINYGFRYLPPEKKYESLARFGYALACGLLKHMDSRELVSQDFLPEEYLPLSALSSDAKAWHLIERASQYMPSICSFDIKEKETIAQITYKAA